MSVLQFCLCICHQDDPLASIDQEGSQVDAPVAFFAMQGTSKTDAKLCLCLLPTLLLHSARGSSPCPAYQLCWAAVNWLPAPG